MDGALQRGRRGDLESQTAFSCPSGTRDGHEPHIGPLEKLLDACERIGSTHEPVVEGREAGRGQRPKWRKLLTEPGSEELEELLSVRHVLEPMLAQGSV